MPFIRISILSLFGFLWGVTLLGTVSLDISSRKHRGRGIATFARQKPCVPAPRRPDPPPGRPRSVVGIPILAHASVAPGGHHCKASVPASVLPFRFCSRRTPPINIQSHFQCPLFRRKSDARSGCRTVLPFVPRANPCLPHMVLGGRVHIVHVDLVAGQRRPY
jgi:hypothetical protein